MKLLVISPHYHTFIKDLVEAQSKYFDEINVFVHHNYLSELARYLPFSYFRHIEKFSKKWLVDLTETPENVKVHVVSSFYFTPDGQNYGLGDKLANLFKKYIEKNNIEFDLIHAHFTWPSGYAAVRLGKKFNVPAVVTAHGYDVYDLPFRNERWKKLIRHVLSSSDYVITVSNKNLSSIRRLDINTPVKLVQMGLEAIYSIHKTKRSAEKS